MVLESVVFFSLLFADSVLPSFVKEFETSWNKTSSYQAQFKQSVRSTRLGSTEESTGALWVSKPGKLRWEGSDGVIQILNGKKVVLIKKNRRKKNRTIDIYENGLGKLDVQALGFLSGGPNFLNNYHIHLVEPGKERAKIQLSSKSSAETFVAEIDKSGYFLAALTTESPEARVRIEFSERKINPPLDDSLFAYVPEPGDVVHKH